MTDPQPSGWAEFWRAVFAVVPIGTALWGALGGGTNALVIRTSMRDAARHVLLGAIVAAGMGGLGAPILAKWLGLPAETLHLAEGGAAGGSVAYLTGSIGAAVITSIIHRVRLRGTNNDETL